MAGNEQKSTTPQPMSHQLIWAIATRKFDEAMSLIGSMNPHELLQADTSGKTAIHEAIDKGAPEIIAALIGKNIRVLNQKNPKNMSPLAFAMQKYIRTPSDFTLSIVNQIYFSLERWQRTRQLEEDLDENIIKVPFAVSIMIPNFRSALWRQALEMCMERNRNGEIESINMSWVDFINKAMDEGLTILGYRVDIPLISMYTRNKYDARVAELLVAAFKTRTTGLAQRTLTQAAVNHTLTQSVEFMSQADMSLPYLIKTLGSPPHGTEEAVICAHQSPGEPEYFYRNKSGAVVKLELEKMSPDQLEKFKTLQIELSKLNWERPQKANFAQASIIEEIRPLQKPVQKQRALPATADLPPPPPRRTLRTLHASGRAPTMFKAAAAPQAKSADDDSDHRPDITDQSL